MIIIQPATAGSSYLWLGWWLETCLDPVPAQCLVNKPVDLAKNIDHRSHLSIWEKWRNQSVHLEQRSEPASWTRVKRNEAGSLYNSPNTPAGIRFVSVSLVVRGEKKGAKTKPKHPKSWKDSLCHQAAVFVQKEVHVCRAGFRSHQVHEVVHRIRMPQRGVMSAACSWGWYRTLTHVWRGFNQEKT